MNSDPSRDDANEVEESPTPSREKEPFLIRRWPFVVRYAGLAIALWETLGESVDRPYLLGLAGSMMLGSVAAEYAKNRK